jgi:hypothetical protein
MPFFKVLSPLKHNRKRHEPGDVLDLPQELGDRLTAAGVVEPSGPPMPSTPPLEQTPDDEPTLSEESTGGDPSTPPLLNINTATAEAIADQINGIGLTTAKAVVKLRDSKPDKAFTSLDELKSISRVDWDAVFPLLTLE